MPFTISHAAAVLPLARSGNSRLPLAALMIGSMSPDFAYFLPAVLDRASSHELEGVFLFCLPLGLASWLLFTRFMEPPTLELLPAAWRQRVPRSDRTLSPRVLGAAAFAVLLGSLTHVAWDAFTHANTAITNAIPWFYAEVYSSDGPPFRVYRLLQYLSSVVGLAALAWWAWNLRHAPLPAPHRVPPRSTLTDRARVVALLAVVMAAAASALISYLGHLERPFSARVFHLSVGGMTGGALAWVGVVLWIRLSPRLSPP
jgi:hypothetical protein